MLALYSYINAMYTHAHPHMREHIEAHTSARRWLDVMK